MKPVASHHVIPQDNTYLKLITGSSSSYLFLFYFHQRTFIPLLTVSYLKHLKTIITLTKSIFEDKLSQGKLFGHEASDEAKETNSFVNSF